jgi:hypothetical protein
MWGDEKGRPAPAAGEPFAEIQALQPPTDVQRNAQVTAIGIANDIGQTRWLKFEQRQGRIPPALLVGLVAWLAGVFVAFGLFSPRNPTVVASRLVSAPSVTGAHPGRERATARGPRAAGALTAHFAAEPQVRYVTVMCTSRLLVSVAVLACTVSRASAQGAPAAPARGARNDLVERAVSAAPPAIGVGAAVVDVHDDGKMVTLREGRDGWTCLPHDPGTPTRAPLCLDANGMLWLQAVMHGKAPDPDLVGYSYMLKGGSVRSATDPSAEKLPPGREEPRRDPAAHDGPEREARREVRVPGGRAPPGREEAVRSLWRDAVRDPRPPRAVIARRGSPP